MVAWRVELYAPITLSKFWSQSRMRSYWNSSFEVTALDILQMEPHITGFLTHLLAGQALANLMSDAFAYTWPGMVFLNPG